MKKQYFYASAVALTSLSLALSNYEFINARPENVQTQAISASNKENSFFKQYTNNFKTNESIPQCFVYIKAPRQNNNYIKVNSNGSLTFVNDKKSASVFAIYKSDTQAKIGYPLLPSIQIQDTKTGKFLTIQSYKNNGNYFNMAADNTYTVTCEAPNVGWNERFNFNLDSDNKSITISSHLSAIRDQQGVGDDYEGGNTYFLHSDSNNGLISSSKEKQPESFLLITANQIRGKLQLASQIDQNKAVIYWHRINQNDKAENYKISEKATIKKMGDLYKAVVPITKNKETIQVNYHAGKTKLKGKIVVKSFHHPGIRLTTKQLDLMKKHVQQKEEPWYSDYLLLKNTVANNTTSFDYEPQFATAIGRGDKPSSGNIGYLEQSSNAAYFNVLQWVITGKKEYAEKTKEILNIWSNLQILDGRDRILGAGLNSVKLATAADILFNYHGGYSGYSSSDLAKLQNMMINVIYPVLQDDGIPMLANGNWDLAADESLIAIGVLNNDYDIYKKALDHMNSSYINGSLKNYIDDSGQTQESGRDMAHAQLGVGLTAEILNTANIQGDNFLTKYDNRLGKASEWIAQYNLTHHVDSFKIMNNIFGKTDKYSYWTKLDEQSISRGELRPIYEQILALYKNKHVKLPWTEKAAAAMRPQGMINNDNYNFDTLTFYNGSRTEKPEPVFNLRSRVEPWYNRQLINITGKNEYEPYTSYFSVTSDGSVVANKLQKDADKFKLITNDDGTYSILDLKNQRYLDIENGSNQVFANAGTIMESSKFKLISNGLGFYALAPKIDPTHLLETQVTNEKDPAEAKLNLVVGKNSYSSTKSVDNKNRFIFMYQLN